MDEMCYIINHGIWGSSPFWARIICGAISKIFEGINWVRGLLSKAMQFPIMPFSSGFACEILPWGISPLKSRKIWRFLVKSCGIGFGHGFPVAATPWKVMEKAGTGWNVYDPESRTLEAVFF